jgi:hypothetical protein
MSTSARHHLPLAKDGSEMPPLPHPSPSTQGSAATSRQRRVEITDVA